MYDIYMYIYTHTHTQNGILLSNNKNEILPFVTIKMDLEGITPNEINHKERNRKTKYDLVYMWNLKSKTNKQTKQT